MICLNKIKYKQVVYEDHITKHMELNESTSPRCKTSEDLVIKDSF
jgi:hypothetical protein